MGGWVKETDSSREVRMDVVTCCLSINMYMHLYLIRCMYLCFHRKEICSYPRVATCKRDALNFKCHSSNRKCASHDLLKLLTRLLSGSTGCHGIANSPHLCLVAMVINPLLALDSISLHTNLDNEYFRQRNTQSSCIWQMFLYYISGYW